jgi:hypothetical protein
VVTPQNGGRAIRFDGRRMIRPSLHLAGAPKGANVGNLIALLFIGMIAGCATAPQVAHFTFNSGRSATMYADGSASYQGGSKPYASTWTKNEAGEYKVTWPTSPMETRCYPSGRNC